QPRCASPKPVVVAARLVLVAARLVLVAAPVGVVLEEQVVLWELVRPKAAQVPWATPAQLAAAGLAPGAAMPPAAQPRRVGLRAGARRVLLRKLACSASSRQIMAGLRRRRGRPLTRNQARCWAFPARCDPPV